MDHRFDESYPFVYIGHVCLFGSLALYSNALSHSFKKLGHRDFVSKFAQKIEDSTRLWYY